MPINIFTMHKSFLFLAIFFVFSCNNREEDCNCRSLENCVGDNCVLQPNSYYINNQGVKGVDLYHGVVSGNVCTDTIAFDINLADPSRQFSLYANVAPLGLYQIPLDIGQKISDNEYILGSASTICRLANGKEWYPSYIHCKINTDQILMTIKFLERFDTSGEFVDSCQVTLVK